MAVNEGEERSWEKDVINKFRKLLGIGFVVKRTVDVVVRAIDRDCSALV